MEEQERQEYQLTDAQEDWIVTQAGIFNAESDYEYSFRPYDYDGQQVYVELLRDGQYVDEYRLSYTDELPVSPLANYKMKLAFRIFNCEQLDRGNQKNLDQEAREFDFGKCANLPLRELEALCL